MGLTLQAAGRLATIVIGNPAKRNTMTADMWRALPRLLEQVAADAEIRVLVLTGAEGNFCAGADISGLSSMGADTAEGNLAVAAEEALAAFPLPTIAMIEGACIGGGCQLAFACDLRIAADDARFGVTPARLGIVYPAASTRRLVQLAGVAVAKRLLLTADLFSGAHAAQLGLVTEAVPAARLAERVREYAAVLASRSLLSQAAAKDLVAMAASGDIDEHRVDAWMQQVRGSGEAAEGAAAFLERRAPAFRWRPSPRRSDGAGR